VNLKQFYEKKSILFCLRAGIAQSVRRLSTGWEVRGSNPGSGEIFRTRPDWSLGPTSLLYNWYRVSFLAVKWPERGDDLSPPSESSWPLLGRTLPLPLSLYLVVQFKLSFFNLYEFLSSIISVTHNQPSPTSYTHSSFLSLHLCIPLSHSAESVLSLDPPHIFVDISGRAGWGVSWWPLDFWDCGFESLRGLGCPSVFSVVRCQVEVSASGWSLFRRSPTECDREALVMLRP